MKLLLASPVLLMLLVLGACGPVSNAFAQSSLTDSRGPFIAGFDRFARHAEIESKLAGRLLVSELSCSACHVSKDETFHAKMGPRLNGVAARITTDWIKQFIAAPLATKPGTTMPDVLSGLNESDRGVVVQTIAAYLSTQSEPLPEIKGSGLLPVPHEFWNKGSVDRGRELYHRVGCVACHATDNAYPVTNTSDSALDRLLETLDPEELAELGLAGETRAVNSIPLPELKRKYTLRGLTTFLLDPTLFRPAGRMPSLKLTPTEAADITAYLLNDQSTDTSNQHAATPEIANYTDAEIQQGRRHFVSLQCVNCHTTNDAKATIFAKPFEQLSTNSGCLRRSSAPSVRSTDTAVASVDYRLDEPQITAINSLIEGKDLEISPSEALQLQLLSLNCFACHQRDGIGGVGRDRKPYFETKGHIDLGDEGRLPPPLTGVGRKLQITWAKNVLQGKKADVRPHMFIRMPIFATPIASELPDRFAKIDEASSKSDREVFGEIDSSISPEQFVNAGRQLMDVGCVQCHQFGGNSLPGVIGVDVHNISARVRPQWFHDFLLNPGAVKNRTRMPTFFPDGKSQRMDLLGGDPEKQIASMWAYLNKRGDIGLPDKIVEARNQNYELRPTEHPLILRTFMKEAGTHAIAVGFPEHVHFAFDTQQMRLALGWRGRFIDAQGTWFVRAAPPAEPLGEAKITLQEFAPFALLENPDKPWPSTALGYQFNGYRLDKARIPTLLYGFSGFEIEDRITPLNAADSKQYGLHRKLTLRSTRELAEGHSLWMLITSARELTKNSSGGYRTDSGLTVSLGPQTNDVERSVVRNTNDNSEWLLPVSINDEAVIEVHYRW